MTVLQSDKLTTRSDRPAESTPPVTLRPYPYPYQAMLAICSDLDETPDRRVYHQIMRYLNTRETTAMGPGVGLEVGNTIYFDMGPGNFAYWNTDDAGRAMVRDMIKSGHIDCLHSYGDLATTRAHAGRALDELARHDCRLEAWIDHAVAPTNFGADIMRGQGDVPGAPAYHADLTCGFGVKYVWRGRVTSVIGQEVRPSLRSIISSAHPLASARTCAKEAAKRMLGRLGSEKYAPHVENRAVFDAALRDGRPVCEFLRSNPYWKGVGLGATGREIGSVLNAAMLHRLVQRRGVCLLYTHLGKIRDINVPFDPPAAQAFRHLAQMQSDGRILVRTTSRLLRYLTMRERVIVSATRANACLTLYVRWRGGQRFDSIDLPADDLGGLTCYVPDCEVAHLHTATRKYENLPLNPPDETGRRSVTIPWPDLTFPSL